jgi:hypothetical protein
VDLPGPRWPKLPGHWPEGEPFDHLGGGGGEETDFFFSPLLSGSLFRLYFIVLDIFERRGLDGAFVSLLGFPIFHFLHPSLATMEF